MKQVYCYELDTLFPSISQAAGATICAQGLDFTIDTVGRRIRKAMNTELDAYGFHFCSPELKDEFIEFMEGDDIYV